MKNLKLTLLAFTLLLPLAAFAQNPSLIFTTSFALKAGRLGTDYGPIALIVENDEGIQVEDATCELVDGKGELPDGLSLSAQ